MKTLFRLLLLELVLRSPAEEPAVETEGLSGHFVAHREGVFEMLDLGNGNFTYRRSAHPFAALGTTSSVSGSYMTNGETIRLVMPAGSNVWQEITRKTTNHYSHAIETVSDFKIWDGKTNGTLHTNLTSYTNIWLLKPQFGQIALWRPEAGGTWQVFRNFEFNNRDASRRRLDEF